MREIFYPNSIAVIGVSSRPTNLGRNIVSNLIAFGFQGIVYAVGPRGGIIATRRIYSSVQDIPDHIDLAVILTPAHTIPDMLEECGQKGIRWAVIESAGFREYGEQGRPIEEQLENHAPAAHAGQKTGGHFPFRRSRRRRRRRLRDVGF